MNENIILPKHKFRMCVTTLEKAGENEERKVKDSKWVKGNGAQFRRDFYESKANGESLSIEIVDEKPTSFKVNQIYLLRTRDVVWVWVED